MTSEAKKVVVTVRTNEGENQIIQASDVAEALRIAKKQRTPESYMVCVVQDGVRTLRWDRPTVVGENRWRKVDPRAFEKLGQAARCTRTYIYITVEQEKAERDAWLAVCPDDNQEFANAIHQQIAADTLEKAPSVREAIIDKYERLGIQAMFDLMRKAPGLVETYLEYVSFQKRLRPLDPVYTPFTHRSECCGIKHPSVELTPAVHEQIKERGFRRTSGGWRDAREVKIDESEWLDLNRVRADPSLAFGWNDPAGIIQIYKTYTDLICRLQVEAGPTVRTYEQAHKAGWAAYRDGLPLVCKAPPDSLEGYGWILGWQSAYLGRGDLPYEELQRLRASGIEGEITFDQIPFLPKSAAEDDPHPYDDILEFAVWH